MWVVFAGQHVCAAQWTRRAADGGWQSDVQLLPRTGVCNTGADRCTRGIAHGRYRCTRHDTPGDGSSHCSTPHIVSRSPAPRVLSQCNRRYWRVRVSLQAESSIVCSAVLGYIQLHGLRDQPIGVLVAHPSNPRCFCLSFSPMVACGRSTFQAPEFKCQPTHSSD